MSDIEQKALVQDYRVYAKMKPFPGPYITAADQIEADGKRIIAQAAEIEKLREALRDIQIEAERERGNWTHLKQVIARKARAALGETK